LWVLALFFGACGLFYVYAWWEGHRAPEEEEPDPEPSAGD